MSFLRQAARILANLIVMGSTILARAVVQAYRQALTNASKNGVAQEAVQNIKRASKTMTEAEARQILGVTENSSWEEIVQKYDNLFERNAQNGSFYLQSKTRSRGPVPDCPPRVPSILSSPSLLGLMLNPPVFTGVEVEEDHQGFVDEIEKIFCVMYATHVKGVEFAAYQLKDVALSRPYKMIPLVLF
ncbi:putative mitochondrial import inner membrane translocase subunit tim-16-like isoform X2 [Capsicum annuum]|nr:putative mitochondrial import inner membrane translocase subunit tim-16-like isoform X2 [Capsicum annuum]